VVFVGAFFFAVVFGAAGVEAVVFRVVSGAAMLVLDAAAVSASGVPAAALSAA
jgi:hypothetical protein